MPDIGVVPAARWGKSRRAACAQLSPHAFPETETCKGEVIRDLCPRISCFAFARQNRPAKEFYSYITASGLLSVLYIGMTSDLAGRAWEHRERVMKR